LLLVRRGLELPLALTGIAARKYLLMTSQSLYVALAAVAGFAGLELASRELTGHGGLGWLLASSGLAIGAAALAGRAALVRGRLATRARCWVERFRGARARRAGACVEASNAAPRAAAPGATDRRLEQFFALGRREELGVTAWFFGSWLCEAFETYLLLRLLGVPIELGNALGIEVVLSLSRMIVFMVPGGLGVQDAGYVLLLGALGIPNPVESGAAFAVLKRGKEVCYAVLGYALLAIDLRAKTPGVALDSASFVAATVPRAELV
jgi:uncharacterized membrane protein YbhN (UPF0104 family)